MLCFLSSRSSVVSSLNAILRIIRFLPQACEPPSGLAVNYIFAAILSDRAHEAVREPGCRKACREVFRLARRGYSTFTRIQQLVTACT